MIARLIVFTLDVEDSGRHLIRDAEMLRADLTVIYRETAERVPRV